MYLLLGACSSTDANNHPAKKPKLIVGIVVDQMRPDYLYRYADLYSDDGFKKLIKEGFTVKNLHYNYIPTYTGPGHASIYTGTTPAQHGIIGNSWYHKLLKRDYYVTEDSLSKGIFSIDTAINQQKRNPKQDMAGKMSPRNMLSTTITDELRINTQFRSKVIGMSIKDRGAILPAGHTANAAYWYDSQSGKFISSTFYMDALPQWVEDFNQRNLADQYLNNTWETLYPIEKYTASMEDDNPYEKVWKGKETASFPYNLQELRTKNGDYSMLRTTPWGNTILVDLAKAAIKKEQLGKGDFTDFLAVSFSTPDYAGHAFGPQSVEIQDIYLRLDRDLANLFHFLDAEVGKGEYLVFLTADHAAAENVRYMQDRRMPADYYTSSGAGKILMDAITSQYGNGEWIESGSNGQVFLNHELLKNKKIEAEEMRQLIARTLIEEVKGVANALTWNEMRANNYTDRMRAALQAGFNPKRSGDVLIYWEPGWMYRMSSGTTHGSGYNYDTHVPMLWYGTGIKQGNTVRTYYITDIASTLAHLLDIKLPNANSGNPIVELFE